MSGFTYYTKDALDQLKADLQKLKTVERQAASKAIAEAREKGDLRENAEYDAAKEAQGLLEAKIQKLEGDLANARVIDQGTIDTSSYDDIAITPAGRNLIEHELPRMKAQK